MLYRVAFRFGTNRLSKSRKHQISWQTQKRFWRKWLGGLMFASYPILEGKIDGKRERGQ